MTKLDKPTESGKQYAAAHDVHYATKNLHKAFILYEDLIAAHPETKEAEYSRSQVQNIVNNVIPKQEVLDTLGELVHTHFKKNVTPVS